MKLFLSIVLAFFFCSVLSAQTMGDTSIAGGIIKMTPAGDNTSKPRTPSNQEITCYYDSECLYISFKYDEGLCEVHVSSEFDGIDVVRQFNSAYESTIYVGELHSADITITTAYGHSYFGAF